MPYYNLTYKSLAVPLLVQTGSLDFWFSKAEVQEHLRVFRDSPPGHKYGLVLAGADHFFGELFCWPDWPMESNATARRPAQIEQFEALQVIVAAFLQAYNTPLPPDRRALWAMQTLEGMACRRGPVQLLLR
jgi:hypothetical protein